MACLTVALRQTHRIFPLKLALFLELQPIIVYFTHFIEMEFE